LTLLCPWQRKQRQLHDKTSCPSSLPSNRPNSPHKYLYLTITTPTTQRQSSSGKGVLDNTTLKNDIIYIPTVSHTMSHLGPRFVLGPTGINRATTFSLSQESNPKTVMYDRIAHKLVMTFTFSSMCETMLSTLQVTLTFYLTFLSMCVTTMPSIRALGAT
jgi:hypothetical protein